MPGLLYYPKINAPQHVLQQAALYWDQIATIVPSEYDRYLSPDMIAMKQAGLYTPILGQSLFLQSATEVFEAIEDFVFLLRRFDQATLVAHDAEPGRGGQVLYVDKVSEDLLEELVDRGLARYSDRSTTDFAEREVWVPPAVEVCLLSILARSAAEQANRSVGCTDANVLRPYTDHEIAHLLSHEVIDGRGVQSCLTVELGDVLPTPDLTTPLADLLEFRIRYEDERVRLVRALDRLTHELSTYYDHAEDVLRTAETEIADSIRDYRAAMKAAQLSVARRSISLIVAIGAGYGSANLGGAFTWLLGVIGGIAISVAASSSRPVRSTRYSYIERVTRTFGGSNQFHP